MVAFDPTRTPGASSLIWSLTAHAGVSFLALDRSILWLCLKEIIRGKMAYFKDLTINTYSGSPEPDVLSVGWLSKGASFQTGGTPDAFQVALNYLCKNEGMNYCMGHHVCEFCPDASWDDPYFFDMGNGEIRVRDADGVWYVAPRLVSHYVVDHNYFPPKEFIEAVLNPSEIGNDPEPISLTEKREIQRKGPQITESDIDEIVRMGTRKKLHTKPWWQFW